MTEANIVLLPGDGVGPEVVEEGGRVLAAVAGLHGRRFEFEEHPIGGIAIDEVGDPLPGSTLDACRSSAAVLLGAVGGPKWDDPQAKVRPEQGLLGLRKGLELFANLRPVRVMPQLADVSPLRPGDRPRCGHIDGARADRRSVLRRAAIAGDCERPTQGGGHVGILGARNSPSGSTGI